MDIIFHEYTILTALFIAVSSYFSFKAGRKEGLEMGAQGCLMVLAQEGIVEFEKDEDGEEYVMPVQYEDD